MLLLSLSLAHAQPLVAVVVVDEEARESGYALELGGWLVEDALPVDVVAGDVVRLVGPDGVAERLDVAAGEAWEIAGASGEAWMSALEEDVRTDLIAVKGSEAALAALATTLGAERFERDGVTYLAGRDVLLDAPWVDDPVAQRVREIRYVRVDELGAAPTADRTASLRTAFREGAVRRPAPLAPGPVGPAAETEPAPPSAPVAAPVASTTAAPATAASSPVAASAPVAAEPESPAPSAVDPLAGRPEVETLREAYAGMFLCRDNPLYLHPAGVYFIGAHQGTWHVGAPGVVRLLGPDGALWYRAAIDPDRGHCRELWTELDPEAAPPTRAPRARSRRGQGPF